MRLGILSDTHDQLEQTRQAVQLLRAAGADVLAHCGDITGPDIIAVCSVLPCYFAFGNHDSDRVPELRQAMTENNAVCLEWGDEITLAGKRVAVVHGHMHTDVHRLIRAQPDYVLSGHSHISGDWRLDGVTRRINPGAVNGAEESSAALLDLSTDELTFISLPNPNRE